MAQHRKIQPPADFSPAPIREACRDKARSSYKRGVSILERIERSQPYWLFVICLGVVALSAVHTTTAFQTVVNVKIAIGGASFPVGAIGVVVVELGLLYCSFARYKALRTEEPLDRPTRIMEYIFFIAAVAVNTTGSISAFTGNGLNLSTNQGVIDLVNGVVMTVIDGAAVPISLIVVGTGVARLVYDRREEIDPFDAYWAANGPDTLYLAFYDDLTAKGMPRADARRYATDLVKDSFPKGKPGSDAERARKATGSAESAAIKTDKIAVKPGELYSIILQKYQTDPVFSAKSRTDKISELMGIYAVGHSAAYDNLSRAEKAFNELTPFPADLLTHKVTEEADHEQ